MGPASGKETGLAIAALVLWLATAAAGLTLLRAGGARRRAAEEVPESAPLAAATATGSPTRTGAIPMTADGRPPRGPRARVTTPPGEHPLLEFGHPALAVVGVACWLMFVLVHYRAFAWIALAILAAALTAGLSWLLLNRKAALRQLRGAWSFPPRLIALHGLAAAVSIALTVVTALAAGRG
jgi:hypothetical protein